MSKRSVALVLLVVAASPLAAATQQASLPEISSASDTAWHDLTFRIQQLRTVRDSGQLLEVAGSYRGTPVGVGVLLGTGWKKGSLGAALVVYSGKVTIRSVGARSDRFLAALNELYGTKQHIQRMSAQTGFAAMSLAGDPTHLNAGPVKLKLFFESDDEARYAELYLNIDVRAGTVELAEKDPDYRAAIVRALSAR